MESDNILIAEFMGGVRFGNGGSVGIVWRFENGDYADHDDLNYNESWDWLMPVVDKIESLGYGFHKSPFDLDIIEYLSGNETKIVALQNDPHDSLIEKWYYVVIEFIKWYNENKAL